MLNMKPFLDACVEPLVNSCSVFILSTPQCQLAEVRGLVSPPSSPFLPFLKGRVKGGGVLEVACTSRPALTDHAVTKWNTTEERGKKKKKDYKCPTVNL